MSILGKSEGPESCEFGNRALEKRGTIENMDPEVKGQRSVRGSQVTLTGRSSTEVINMFTLTLQLADEAEEGH